MKLITIITLLFLIIILSAVGSYFAIRSLADNLNNTLIQLEKNVENEEWEKAKKTYQKVEKQWDRAKKIVTLFIDHSDLRHLNISLTRIYSLIEIKEKKELLPEIKVVKDLVTDIPEEEKLSLNNIF